MDKPMATKDKFTWCERGREHQRQQKHHRFFIGVEPDHEKESGPQLTRMPKANFMEMWKFLPIWSCWTNITEKIDPKMMMNAALKNCVIEEAWSNQKFHGSRSVCKQREGRAGLLHAQNTMLITMKITKAIMRSRHMAPSLMTRTDEMATRTTMSGHSRFWSDASITPG